MEYIIVPLMALACLTTISILILTYNHKEAKFKNKIDLLKHMIDKGYETENVDINNLK